MEFVDQLRAYNVGIVSVLVPVDEMRADRVDGIRRAAILQCAKVAAETLKGAKLTVRDLVPTDLGLTNNEWTETTGATDNQWEDTSIADQTIDDDRFVVLWGCRFITLHQVSNVPAPPISALRIDVGGGLVAQWDLYPIVNSYTINTGTAAGEKAAIRPIAGITESPIIITQGIAVTIRRYVIETATTYKLAFDGAVAEKEGKVLKP